MTRRLTVRRHPVPDTGHAPFRTTAATVPERVVLVDQFGPVVDQLNIGSCTAFAATSVMSWLLSRSGQPWQEFSELAQYWYERKAMGTVSSDSGATITGAIQVLEQVGVIPESAWPYITTQYTIQPPPVEPVAKLDPAQALYLGQRPKASDVLAAVAAGHPVIFGYDVFPGLLPLMVPGDACAYTGLLQMPDATSNALEGGHANVVVGYDLGMGSGYLLIRNQWSEHWGLHGYYWMPLAYWEPYCFDAYAIVAGSPGTSTAPVFPVPSLQPRVLPPDRPQTTAWPSPMPSPWSGGVTVTVPSGQVQAGASVQVQASTSGPLPPDQRVWFGYYVHDAAYDSLELSGWFWWQEMASADRTLWTCDWTAAADTIQDGYHGVVVRVLPDSLSPLIHGDPAYASRAQAYPAAYADGPVIVGAPAPVVAPLGPAITGMSAQVGHAGDEITVTGSGFDALTQVLFGSEVAGVVAWSPYTITVRVPSGSGTAAVTARNANGVSVVGPVTHFTYEEVAPVPQTEQIPVFIDGRQQAFRATVGRGYALVPVDLIAKALGAKATRDQKGVYISTPKAP